MRRALLRVGTFFAVALVALALGSSRSIVAQPRPGDDADAPGIGAVAPTTPRGSAAGVQILRTRRAVGLLAADGARVAISHTAAPTCIESWAPRTGTRVGFAENACTSEERQSEPEWISNLGLAGTRVGWVTVMETLHYDVTVYTATLAHRRPVAAFSRFDEREVLTMLGDKSLLVFEVDPDGLFRLTGTRARRIRAIPGGSRLLAASDGRIAIGRYDGSIVLIRPDGKFLRTVEVGSSRPRAAALSGAVLAVIVDGALRVYDIRGRPVLVARRIVADRVVLDDFESGIVVYRVGRTIRLLRVSDGRTVAISPPGRGSVRAQLEEEGLFYSYSVDDPRLAGRVVFVPFRELLRRLH